MLASETVRTMNDTDRAVEMMNDVLRRKMNSPATYILQASPYATPDDRPIVAEIEAMSATARRHAEEAALRILALEGIPTSGSYESSIADTNYLSVRYLLGQLLARLEQDIRVIEQFRDRCEVLEGRDFFTMVVEDDLAHRDRLVALKRETEEQQPFRGTHLP